MEHWADFSKLTLERMAAGGVFLTVQGEKPNTMTIGWGSLSVYWGKPVFIVPVRESRYTYELLKTAKEFTVSVPGDANAFKAALGICGSRSGRDCDKYSLAGLKLQAGRTVETPVIEDCAVHYECRILTSLPLKLESLPEEIRERCYPKGDAHTLFFGEIVAAYEG